MADTLVRKSNLDKLKRAYETKDESGFKFWKPQKFGKYTVRFLPPWEPDGLFYKEAKQHRVGDNYFFCPKSNDKDAACPICELYRKLWNIGTQEAIDLAREIKGRKQYLYNIVVRDEDGEPSKEPKKVQTYMSGKKLFDSLIDYFFDDEYGDLTDVEKGFDFTIKKEKVEGTDFPSYDNSKPKRNPSPLAASAADVEEILANTKNLDKEVDFVSYDDMKAALDRYLSTEKPSATKFLKGGGGKASPAATATPASEDDDDDETPPRRASVPDEDSDAFEERLLREIEEKP